MAGLYVHIPFCKSRCAYCDFYSTTREAAKEAYVKALCREIMARCGELDHSRVRTIYIGGGTPSVLTPSQLNEILSCIHTHYMVDEDAEVTMEMNPDDVGRGFSSGSVSGQRLRALQLTGLLQRSEALPTNWSVNRVSLGIQTFDDALLRLLRRRHDAQTAVEAVRHLQQTGIGNISIDLIYGLPGQTLEIWERDLDKAFSLGVQHLSAYALSYEEGTALTRWRTEGRVQELPDEVQVQMYERLCQRAHEAGFEHYEISNFALPGYHSRHNSSYWTGEPYLGFGPGAHSYDGVRTRRANRPSLDDYLRNNGPDSGQRLRALLHTGLLQRSEALPTISATIRPTNRNTMLQDFEVLTDEELYDEAVMCGLRTARGVVLEDIERRFGHQKLDYLLAQAAPHLQAGRLALTDGRLHLTARSLMVSDDVMSDLMT